MDHLLDEVCTADTVVNEPLPMKKSCASIAALQPDSVNSAKKRRGQRGRPV